MKDPPPEAVALLLGVDPPPDFAPTTDLIACRCSDVRCPEFGVVIRRVPQATIGNHNGRRLPQAALRRLRLRRLLLRLLLLCLFLLGLLLLR